MATVPRNLLLITLDSVRADYFRSPVIDRLRDSGTYFSQVISAAPDTTVSHASLFSGCYPPVHRARNHAAEPTDEV